MMQFLLSYNNFAEKLQLPVNPKEYMLGNPQKNSTVDIHGLGELNIIGNPGLRQISITSIFPYQYAPYCAYKDIPKPYDAVEQIKKWQATKRPIRLIITGTRINMPVSIENFEYGERGGSRDIEYTLDLKEYRFINVTQINDSAEESIRESDKEISKNYEVKDGDSLYIIAKRETGNSSNWPKIYEDNKNIIGTDPGSIKAGMKLVINV